MILLRAYGRQSIFLFLSIGCARPYRGITPRALGICKQTSCRVLNFSTMAMTASLVIVESALPVHARSCFIAGPPAASLDPSVQATSRLLPPRGGKSARSLTSEGRQDAGSDCRCGNGRVDDGVGAATVRRLRIDRYLRADEGAQHCGRRVEHPAQRGADMSLAARRPRLG